MWFVCASTYATLFKALGLSGCSCARFLYSSTARAECPLFPFRLSEHHAVAVSARRAARNGFRLLRTSSSRPFCRSSSANETVASNFWGPGAPRFETLGGLLPVAS